MFQLNPVPKAKHKRNKPTAAQRGEVTTKVRKALAERSDGRCERCRSARAVQAAHLIRRWQIKGSTTVEDLAHLCVTCHIWADTTRDGREWLKQFQQHLISD